MKVLQFRPFKRKEDKELLRMVYDVFEDIQGDRGSQKENVILCDQLIREAKMRNLCCPKEILYEKILYK